MPLALPLFTVLALGFLIGVVCLMLLHSSACVIRNESRVWDLRNEIEHLRYDYQLQLLRLGNDDTPEDELGEVDIIEDPVAP